MINCTRLAIAPESLIQECLEETLIGEDRSVRHEPIDPYAFSCRCIGLAINFLLIESLQRFHQYYGDDLLVEQSSYGEIIHLTVHAQVECPTGSGEYMNLADVADEIQRRVIHIFARDADGKRATNGGNQKLDGDPHFRDYIWFHEVKTSVSYAFCVPSHIVATLVLPRRHRKRARGITSDRMVGNITLEPYSDSTVSFQVWSGSMSYPAKHDLPPAKVSSKCALVAWDAFCAKPYLALRSVVHHYFDVRPTFVLGKSTLMVLKETIDSHSKHGDDIHSSHSATSAANAGDLNSFGDISPKAL